eukprot:scaffold1_cov402-Prasinococcus_capsulatus_cf.AAC.43
MQAPGQTPCPRAIRVAHTPPFSAIRGSMPLRPLFHQNDRIKRAAGPGPSPTPGLFWWGRWAQCGEVDACENVPTSLAGLRRTGLPSLSDRLSRRCSAVNSYRPVLSQQAPPDA